MPKATAAKPGAARKLKVYRTPAGFYDAYVAAPSQKAAVEALGADKNLFSRGDGEVVTDPKLTAEPLANPGVVIKRKRGSLSEQLAALRPAKLPKPSKAAAPEEQAPTRGSKPRAAKPTPRPSRSALDAAEDELARFEREAKQELAEIRAREAALAKERQVLEAAQAAQRAKLARTAEAQRDRYDAALERWRAALE